MTTIMELSVFASLYRRIRLFPSGVSIQGRVQASAKTKGKLLNIHVAVAVINVHLQCKEGHWWCLLYNKSSPPEHVAVIEAQWFTLRGAAKLQYALNIQRVHYVYSKTHER